MTDNVFRSGEQPLDMMKRNDSITADSVISHDEPVDMTVSRENVDVNTSQANVNNSDPNNLEHSHENRNESDEVNTVHNSNASNVESATNDVQHEDGILEQPNMTEGSVGSSNISNVEGFVHEDNQNSSSNIPHKVSTSQQIENVISADSPHCQVNIERTDKS